MFRALIKHAQSLFISWQSVRAQLTVRIEDRKVMFNVTQIQ